jgi:hypothetical protein
MTTQKKLVAERRQRHLTKLIQEAVLNVIAEQAQQLVPPPPAPQPNQTVPEPTLQDPAQQAQPNQGAELSVDSLIERLNVIRGGKSFTDPQVYEAMTNFYNGLNPQDKESLDRNLTEIGKVVISAAEAPAPAAPATNNPGVPTAPMGGQTPPPGPAASGGAPITPIQ